MTKHSCLDVYFFVLGGEDNEMAEIKRVLVEKGIDYYQPQTDWGTIEVSKDELPLDAVDKQLVFVECVPDWKQKGVCKTDKKMMVIDHHGELCERDASLLQVLKLLKIKPTVRQQIIASIDSNFLWRTIERWPKRREEIIEVWESGYKKKFDREEDFVEFKNYCLNLFKTSKVLNEKVVVIEKAPESMTMLAAIADLKRLSCILIVGKLNSNKAKPCFFQGDAEVVKMLVKNNFDKSYWGKYYFGCREVPKRFVKVVCNRIQ